MMTSKGMIDFKVDVWSGNVCSFCKVLLLLLFTCPRCIPKNTWLIMTWINSYIFVTVNTENYDGEFSRSSLVYYLGTCPVNVSGDICNPNLSNYVQDTKKSMKTFDHKKYNRIRAFYIGPYSAYGALIYSISIKPNSET